MGLHYILQHLDKTWELRKDLICGLQLGLQYHHAWPSLRQTDMALCVHLDLSVDHQLPNRQAAASEPGQTLTISTGAPQGCVLSPLLFFLYINDCTSKDPSVKLLKFADDTTVIGLIKDRDESAYRQAVEQLAVWCILRNLELNTLKTVEMIVDFRRTPPPPLSPHSPSWTALWLK